jgi:hypothetical protein
VLRREQIKMVLLAAKETTPTGIQQGEVLPHSRCASTRHTHR